MFSSLILNFLAVEWCLGEILSSPSVCGWNMTPLVQMLILTQKTKKRIELLWQGTACFKGCFENIFWKNSGERDGRFYERNSTQEKFKFVQMEKYTWVLH